MLLGNLLLALAWAALQGEFSLATLVTGHVLGYFILLALVRGGVLARVAVYRTGPSRRRPRWPTSSGSSSGRTCGSPLTWRRPGTT